MVVWGLADLARRFSPVKILVPIVGISMLVATSIQIPYWKNTQTVFEHANQVTRNNFLALTLLGSIRADKGDLAGAMEMYHEALRIKPNYAEGHFFLARALEQQGNVDQASSEFATALQQNPYFQQAHLFYGLLLVREKKNVEAAAQYEDVLSINPQSASAHNDLARLLQSEGKLDESLLHYIAALKCDPSLAEAHNNLGVLYLQKGQLAESAKELRAALRLNPDNVETKFNLAIVLNEEEQWSEALAIFEKLAPGKTDNPELHYQYGLALEHSGETREAMSQFANALLLAPDLGEALNELAWIVSTDSREELRNGGQAVALAEKACALTARQRPDFLLTLAAADAEAGRFQVAVATAKEGLDLAQKKGQKDLQAKAQNMLETFQAGRAFRVQPVKTAGN
jgi:tetratricopeptide (TPR) repeat protein